MPDARDPLEELKALAVAAREVLPVPWTEDGASVLDADRVPIVTAVTVNTRAVWASRARSFIAAASPDVVAALVEVALAARQRISGSHAMGCDAYPYDFLPNTGPCDCGREDLTAALFVLDTLLTGGS